jgi:hypothetical protein
MEYSWIEMHLGCIKEIEFMKSGNIIERNCFCLTQNLQKMIFTKEFFRNFFPGSNVKSIQQIIGHLANSDKK